MKGKPKMIVMKIILGRYHFNSIGFLKLSFVCELFLVSLFPILLEASWHAHREARFTHRRSGLSRTVGGSLLQFAPQGQPSAGAAQALGSYRCTLASPAARWAGGHCGICGDREPQV